MSTLYNMLFQHVKTLISNLSNFATKNHVNNRILLRNNLTLLKKYLPTVTNKSMEIVNSKFNGLIMFYKKFTGLDEVEISQNRVVEAQEKFVLAQEKRRSITMELKSIQSQLRDIYVEIDKTDRGDEKYLHLITTEIKLLKEERKIQEKFTFAENEERELFNLLSASVKLSHEKQRTQGEKTKYWSLIVYMIGTVLGVMGASINDRLKMKRMVEYLKDVNGTEEQKRLIQFYVDKMENLFSQQNDLLSSQHKELISSQQNTLETPKPLDPLPDERHVSIADKVLIGVLIVMIVRNLFQF